MLGVCKEAADAAATGDLAYLKKYLGEQGSLVNQPTIFQSKLLHLACKNGQLEVARYLISLGADIAALDYGGMRRTPLHWACFNNHLLVIELLVDAGANPKATGPGWQDLVKQRACGKKVDTESLPAEPASSLCVDPYCWLAVMKPEWSIENHHRFPARFKAAVQLLLKASQICDKETGKSALSLNLDTIQEVAVKMAYPVSSWIG